MAGGGGGAGAGREGSCQFSGGGASQFWVGSCHGSRCAEHMRQPPWALGRGRAGLPGAAAAAARRVRRLPGRCCKAPLLLTLFLSLLGPTNPQPAPLPPAPPRPAPPRCPSAPLPSCLLVCLCLHTLHYITSFNVHTCLCSQSVSQDGSFVLTQTPFGGGREAFTLAGGCPVIHMCRT